ncbi:MAG TPA: MgtC/SapB family protein [Xanthomonadales bacterium]|nr:MgtC/SapB family protein [Xanthomonadales bacterium]
MLDVDWNTIVYHLVLMGASYLLALPIGWNRERNSRSAGLRTFPLVAVATCGFILVGIDVLADQSAQARVMEGVITGIGFIGGGAILKNRTTVSGTATAASLWATCAIGVAVAWQRFEIALVLSLVTFLTLQLMPEIKPLVSSKTDSETDS